MDHEKRLSDGLLGIEGLAKDAGKAMVDRVRESVQQESRRMKIYRLVVVFFWLVLAGLWIGGALSIDPGKAIDANLPWFTAGVLATGVVVVLSINYELRGRRLSARRLEARLIEIEFQIVELRRAQMSQERK